MKAEIIATGTELLLGELTDTNTPFIASHLAMLGIDIYYASTVGDNYQRLLGALKQAWQRSDVVILTGGLGPTQGDITRDVIAGLLGEQPQVDEDLKQYITAYFSRIGIEMPANNIKQATLIPSATALRNPFGTAPGWWVEKQGKIVIALPGPPGENQPMWQNEVLPRLEPKTGATILSRTLKLWGLSEAKVDQLVSPFLSGANPTLAIYAKQDGIHLRITAKAVDRESARKMIAERERDLKAIFKDYVWGVDSDTLEGVAGQLLRSKGLTLAVAESFTGGFLSFTLAGAPESSAFFKGGMVIRSDASKALLGLESTAEKRGAESAAMLAGSARAKFGADIGIGIDGTAESDKETTETVFIAIDAGSNGEPVAQSYSWRPHQLIRRATMQALFQLMKYILSLR